MRTHRNGIKPQYRQNKRNEKTKENGRPFDVKTNHNVQNRKINGKIEWPNGA